MSKEEFLKLLETHDWWYMMSDDHRYYRKGHSEWQVISNAMSENPELKKVYEEYKENI